MTDNPMTTDRDAAAAAYKPHITNPQLRPAYEAAFRAGWDAAMEHLTNCTECGRIVDTREESDGGDPHGAELEGGEWVCSFACWCDATNPPASTGEGA